MSDVNEMLDTLYGALISVARASESNPLVGDATYDVLVGGLAAADACRKDKTGAGRQENASIPAAPGSAPAVFARKEYADDMPDLLNQWTASIRAEKHRLVPKCAICANPCGRTAEYDLKEAETKEERSLISAKRELLSELGELAAEIAKACGSPEGARLYRLTPDQEGFFAWALFEIGYEDSADGLKEVFDTLPRMKEDTLREK